jgi:hypothetical protein
MYSGKFILAALYLRQVGIDGRIYAAAQVPIVITPPAPAPKHLGVGLRRPCLGCVEEQSKYEQSEQARAPHTNGPRDVPRFGALSLL